MRERVRLVRHLVENLYLKIDAFSKLTPDKLKSARISANERTRVNPAEVEYYAGNARDAMGHLLVSFADSKEVLQKLIEVAKTTESSFSSRR